jgi:hypothetical protein
MAKKHLGCADSNCGYYWQDADEDYPSCHFDGFGKAPCEEDDCDGVCDEEDDPDPFNEHDPYVVTNPMAFY